MEIQLVSSISINNSYKNSVNFGQKLTVISASAHKARTLDQDLLRNKADNYLQKGDFSNAITDYESYLQRNIADSETNLNLAKAYTYDEQYSKAIPYFQNYLRANPNDIECITMLGESYKKSGMISQAIECFNKALSIEPNYDYARRNLLDAQNLKLSLVDPQKASEEKYNTAIRNLTEAIKIAKSFLPKGYTNNMKDLTVSFDKTAKMGGRSNIAQYEHNKRKISVTDEYTYADPRLTGAYIIHEFVHGKDNDPYTSIREEQDAYRIQAQYWVKNSKDIYDPEMDYVADLYKQSSATLDNRVAEIYKLRDPNIAEISYNHPPSSNTKISKSDLKHSQNKPLRAYDIIV